MEPGTRIALFSGNYNYVRDGASQALNQLVGYLQDVERAKVRVYSPVTATPAFAPAGTLVPVRSVPFPGRSEYRVALGLPRSVREDIARFDPNLFHLSAPDWLGTGAQRLARRLGKPVVASLHTRFETYFDYYGLGWMRRAVERRLSGFYSNSDMIVVPTPALLRDFSGRFGRDRVRLWGRGVDTALFHPGNRSASWRRARGIGDEDIVLLFFGRLVLEKGVRAFCETVDALAASGLSVRPLVIGDGPARAEMARLLPAAIFTGQLAGKDLGTAVASADIVINPSVTEAFGNVVLESMAAGLAVVAADVGSATNLVDHGVSGLLSTPGCTASIAGHVGRLILDPAFRIRLQRTAAAAAQAHDWPSASRQAVQVYKVLLGVPRTRREGAFVTSDPWPSPANAGLVRSPAIF